MKKIYFYTLGCAKNEVDSNKMQKQLSHAGFGIAQDQNEADAILINTCSFIEAATSESIDAILDFANAGSTKKLPIIVTGCLPARYRNGLDDEMPEVSAFVACDEEKDIVQVVESLIGKSDTKTHTNEAKHMVPSAYVKISEGCNRACSFCTIPLIRGAYQSFSMTSIIEEVSELQALGCKEINLIAQDTASWGKDFSDKNNLSHLLDCLASQYKDIYFRILYIQPDEITDDLLFVIAKHENIIKYLDIPLQHISKHILHDMNRSGNRETFENLISHIKGVIDCVTLRTTLMVGFPGETDEDFEELLDFACNSNIDYIGVFAYSDEDEAPSSKLNNKIDEQEKAYRLETLCDAINSTSAANISSKIGTKTKVLIEGIEEDGQHFGRALFQAPEVDGIAYVNGGEVGDVVDAKIIDTCLYDIECEIIK